MPKFWWKNPLLYATSFVILVSHQGQSSGKNMLNAEVQHIGDCNVAEWNGAAGLKHKAEFLSISWPTSGIHHKLSTFHVNIAP